MADGLRVETHGNVGAVIMDRPPHNFLNFKQIHTSPMHSMKCKTTCRSVAQYSLPTAVPSAQVLISQVMASVAVTMR